MRTSALTWRWFVEFDLRRSVTTSVSRHHAGPGAAAI
jgi:hypothetical protein